MKNRILTLTFLLALPVSAVERFRCMPSLRQTHIYAEQTAENFKMIVTNPMGYDYMPQYEGPVAAAAVPIQKMQFEELKALGDQFVVTWPAKSCTINKTEKTVQCDGEATTGVADIKSYILTTSQITEKVRGDVYKKLRYRLGLEKDGNFYFVTFEFIDLNCEAL